MGNDTRRILTSAGLFFALAVFFVGAGTAQAQISGTTDRNTSQKPGDDNECAIVKNPTNANQLFLFCNTFGAGLFAARTTDSGVTWIYPDPSDKTIADGDPNQGPAACCDPTAAWDNFGNLFITYIDAGVSNIVTILSTDGGATFSNLASFTGNVDQPTVAVGANSVWIAWNQSGSMVARGASVTGLGVVGAFNALQSIPGTSGCSFGDVTIGPTGQVVQVCESPNTGEGPAALLVNVDADGLGAGGFGSPITATMTNVGGFDHIPPQASRSVDAEAGLVYDTNPASPRFGRLYLMYTDETVNENNDTDIMLRWSDNDGTTWSSPIRVNDDPSTPIRSQFNPRIAFDPVNAYLGICWHDCRNSATNTAMQIFCTATGSVPSTPAFLPNALISDGASTSNGIGVEFGDYAGLAYRNGVMHPAWADTSNSTGNNPDGTTRFDAYTDRVTGTVPVGLMSIEIR